MGLGWMSGREGAAWAAREAEGSVCACGVRVPRSLSVPGGRRDIRCVQARGRLLIGCQQHFIWRVAQTDKGETKGRRSFANKESNRNDLPLVASHLDVGGHGVVPGIQRRAQLQGGGGGVGGNA